MPTKDQKPTSKAAREFIKPHTKYHRERIKDALEIMKVGGTYEQIARVAGMKDSQCWKRLSECGRDGEIFDTGITRKLSSGLQGTVWQLTNKKIVDVQNPKTEKEKAIIKQLSLL